MTLGEGKMGDRLADNENHVAATTPKSKLTMPTFISLLRTLPTEGKQPSSVCLDSIQRTLPSRSSESMKMNFLASPNDLTTKAVSHMEPELSE